MPTRLVARPPADPAEARRLRKLAVARHAPASWIQRAQIITGSWDGASVAELAERLGCTTKRPWTSGCTGSTPPGWTGWGTCPARAGPAG